MDFTSLEYCVIGYSVALGEGPLQMPRGCDWVLLNSTMVHRIRVDPLSKIFLAIPDHHPARRHEWSKFEFRQTTNDGISLYVSHNGYGALVRPVPFRGCKVVVGLKVEADVVQIERRHPQTGNLLYLASFPPDQRLTSSHLNRMFKYALVDRDEASHNSVFSLHWSPDGPRIPSNKLMWKPSQQRVIRRPAAYAAPAGHDE